MAHTPDNSGYEQFLTRLRAKERYEPPPRSRGKEKLAGMLHLLELLGHPERRFKVVHIAGTNGKGMTAAMVARLLGQSGLKVGIYTSPHLTDIRERIVLQGRPIPEREFQAAGEKALDLAEAMGPEPYLSYFDLLTAMGMLAIAEAGMEWAVLETGLGGFSDATNTTDKALAVITAIGLDHMAVLGDNLRDIAEQKLGILRPGVPTCLAPQHAELKNWLEQRAGELGGRVVPVEPLAWERLVEPPTHLRVWPAGKDTGEDTGEDTGKRAGNEAGEATYVDIAARLAPPPRLACAATALAAAQILLGPAHGESLARRLEAALHTPVPGRLDYREQVAIKNYSGAPFTCAVLDGGHNLPALQILAEQLMVWDIKGYTLIFGMQRDKLLPLLQAPLAQLLGGAARIITLAPKTPRSPSTAQLHDYIQDILRDAGPAPRLLATQGPREALLEAAQWPGEPLVVAGSFWMLGDIMGQLEPAAERGEL